MRAKTAEGRRLETIARESVRRQSNEMLATAWLLTEAQPMSEALAMTRGWLMDELETRMNALDKRDAKSPCFLGQSTGRFDRWIWTDGDAVDPLPFLR